MDKHNTVNLSGLWGSSGGFLIEKIFSEQGSNLIVITENMKKAESLLTDLRFFSQRPEDMFLIADDIKIYDDLSKSDMPGRIRTIFNLTKSRKPFLAISSLENLLIKTVPLDVLRKNTITIKVNDVVDFEALKNNLIEYGYIREEKVFCPGYFSVRGDIIDIYVPFYSDPVRIELFDNVVESIRFFSKESQKSTTGVDQIMISPASFLIKKKEYLANFDKNLKELIKRQDKIFQKPETIWYSRYRNIIKKDLAEEWEKEENPYSALPLLYHELDPFFKFLPEKTTLFFLNSSFLESEIDPLFDRYTQIYENQIKHNKMALPPPYFLISKKEIGHFTSSFKTVFADIVSTKKSFFHFKFEGLPPYKGNFNSLKEDYIKNNQDHIDYTFISDTETNLTDFKNKITEHLGTRMQFRKGQLENSFTSLDFKQAFIQENDFYGKIRFEKGRTPLLIQALESLAELKEGDFVVHIENGIGIYKGLRHLRSKKLTGDFLQIEFDKGMTLFLPVEKISKIHRYIGDDENPPQLNKLGSASFEKTKDQVRRSVTSIARDLVKIYAIRQNQAGFKYPQDSSWQKEFEQGFSFIETPDQIKSLEEIKRDMESSRSMDRLVCGDVGYGKTELAIRAAFKAVTADKQVAVLVPTTILAYQHYNTFSDRLKNFPVRVEMVSRLNSARHQKKILKDLAEGKVEIVIGTHRLIQPDVKFRDLGLVVIDEEHRFGVTHKERLKMIRATVDVISMSATPIPRTLYMALSGIRDISIINTPPMGRIPVKTKIVKFSPAIIRQAILFELDRGGQVYFLHNRVQSIMAIAAYLKRTVPEVKIGVVHGQMDPDEMELTMLDFMEKKFDCLVCTTIIEAGIDLPDVTTIMINRADTFGLAQLYQLRGRVGRSDKQSYAYLLIPSEDMLTETALKRLLTIFEYTDLGSGYKIAMRDLQIRGSGNVFGVQQHGNILAVGLEMYCKILNKVILKLKGEETEEVIEPEFDFDYEAFIPDSYIRSNNFKIEVYKKINRCQNKDDLRDLEKELKDRFGAKIPSCVKNLFLLQEIKILATNLGIEKITELKQKKYEYLVEIVFHTLRGEVRSRIKEKIRHYSLAHNRLHVSLEIKYFLINLKKLLQSLL